eukprot:6176677-Pyramimonas_sp.AAC.1
MGGRLRVTDGGFRVTGGRLRVTGGGFVVAGGAPLIARMQHTNATKILLYTLHSCTLYTILLLYTYTLYYAYTL